VQGIKRLAVVGPADHDDGECCALTTPGRMCLLTQTYQHGACAAACNKCCGAFRCGPRGQSCHRAQGPATEFTNYTSIIGRQSTAEHSSHSPTFCIHMCTTHCYNPTFCIHMCTIHCYNLTAVQLRHKSTKKGREAHTQMLNCTSICPLVLADTQQPQARSRQHCVEQQQCILNA
jgi:hypothetical protein